MKDDELLHKWVNGTITAEELAIFKTRPEYESLVAVHQYTEQLVQPEFDEKTMLQSVLNAPKKETVAPKKTRRLFLSNWIKYGVAASILLFATFWFWPKEEEAVPFLINYELAKGERENAHLPDGSKFVLNAESTLSYDLEKWKTDRSLELSGEAFFDVKKGSTFRVITPNGEVQVVGTQFNVKSRKKGLEVQCYSGLVNVFSSSGRILDKLKANDGIYIQGGMVKDKRQLQNAKKAKWLDGVFSFKKASLAEVLEVLERQFNVEVEADNINMQEEISCSFQNEDLELALKLIATPLGIKYKINRDRKVQLYK